MKSIFLATACLSLFLVACGGGEEPAGDFAKEYKAYVTAMGNLAKAVKGEDVTKYEKADQDALKKAFDAAAKAKTKIAGMKVPADLKADEMKKTLDEHMTKIGTVKTWMKGQKPEQIVYELKMPAKKDGEKKDGEKKDGEKKDGEGN